jgi:ClpP class serine protease
MNPLLSIFAQPMAIEPRARRALRDQALRLQITASTLADFHARRDARRSEAPGIVEGTGGTLRIVGNVGILSIRGPLFRATSEFDEWLVEIFGGTLYDSIWRGIEAGLKSDTVRTLLLLMNTPGGDADGCGELARYIYEARSRKRVVAHNDGICASAGIWLASQAESITSVEEGEIGSIGVRCGFVDWSKFEKDHGIEEVELVSDISPGKRSKPLDDEVLGRIQTRINDLAALFAGAVARGRECDVEKVINDFGQGDVLIASKALSAGLIDGISDLNVTIAALQQAASTTSSAARAARASEASMSTQHDPLKRSSTPAKKAGDDAGEPMRCAECKAEIPEGEAKYCAKCYDEPDGDEEEDEDKDGEEAKAARAAGLFGATKADTRTKLLAFAAAVLGATDSKTAASALGKVTANASAAAELERFRAETDKANANARADSFAAKLATAVASGRVTIGMVCKEVPLLLGTSKAAARTALEAIPASVPPTDAAKAEARAAGKVAKATSGWTAAAIVGALASVAISADALESLDEWLAAKGAGPALPAARSAPVPTAHSIAAITTASAQATQGIEVDGDGNPAAPKTASFSIARIKETADGGKENVR